MATDRVYRSGAEALTSLLIESVVDYAIFVLDPHGGVRSWNPGAQRLKGYQPHEIIGKDFSIFYTPEDREAGVPGSLLAQAAAEGRVRHTGWRVRKDGTRFFGDITITALYDGGELVGYAKVTRDRTEQHEADVAMARALERERRSAQELSRLEEDRARFMASISHDLRSNLSVIKGSLALLDPADGDDRNLVDVMSRNIERLLAMTAQLAELARLERGQLELDRRPTDLEAATRECIASLGPLLAGIETEVACEGVVDVDQLALQRMLTNLIDNAARHSPPGGRVRISSRPEPPSVVLVVDDDGPGVPLEERGRIFDEFRQGRSDADATGLGLGLSIVRQYAEAHGGTIWVDDAPGRGARFCLALPVSAVEAPAPPDGGR